MHEPWKLSQTFSIRASTMLLLYLPILLALAHLSKIIPEPIASYLSIFVGASGEAEYFVLVLAGVFGLAFFVATVVKRNPQVQYVAEFIIAAGLIVTWPVY